MGEGVHRRRDASCINSCTRNRQISARLERIDTKRVRSLSETSEKLEKNETLDLDLDLEEKGDLEDKLGQRRDTLASIDSGIGEELTEDDAESEHGEEVRTDPETGLRLIS